MKAGAESKAWRTYEAQRRKCMICGHALALRFASRDHVFPRGLFQRGEPHRRWNFVLAHRKCNEQKGDRMPTDDEYQTLAAINIVVANATP